MNKKSQLIVPIIAMVAAMVSVTSGVSIARQLFMVTGPASVTALRLAIGAVLLSGVFRVWRVRVTWGMIRAAFPYGLSLGAMNLFFYMAISRIPLGVALGIEFIGPLTVATFGLRRLQDFGWITLVILGLALLLPFSAGGAALNINGVMLAAVSGVFWGIYIIMGQKAGKALGVEAPALGMIFAALCVLPFSILDASRLIMQPHVIMLAVLVALLSSAIPYSLEMFALRRLPVRIFGVLTSGEPVVGALAGLLLLHEELPLIKWLGIVSIVCASIGMTVTAGSRGKKIMLEN
ncbi:EamA family transporter [Acetobacter suratthaniensis]|uniref:EamA family transporter n=2 Tax=Acetobacter suratthaniensis TaxID=1502841 RepID=A0ABS3LND1_9PROT|nr:EamA family transporter [Acetobacter suratthaniensis]